MDNKLICVLCEEKFEGFGNNANPIADGVCCDECNIVVIKKRLEIARKHQN